MTLRPLAAGAVALATLAVPFAAEAHRAWFNPSATVLSGDDPWVTVDAAISNDLFYPDHFPMQLSGVSVVGPDGGVGKVENPATGKYRSTFDVHLAQPGTYKVVSGGQPGAFASYKLNGEVKRWRGQESELATAVPQGATEVKVTRSVRRIETFLTRGAPTEAALKPQGVGLELQPISHPNDLVAGEPGRFRLLLDGKPAAGVKVSVLPGAARYRKDPGEIHAETGADGAFQVAWPEAGMYWLEAETRSGTEADGRSASYIATLEVLPE